MATATVCSDFGAPQNKVWHCFTCFPIYLPWSDGTRCHDLHFLNVEFSANFSLSSFTFIKRLLSSSSLSAIKVVSSAYMLLLLSRFSLRLSIQKVKIMASGPINSWEIDGETVETVPDFIFFWTPKSLQILTALMKLKAACSLEEKLWPTWQHIKKQRHYFVH